MLSHLILYYQQTTTNLLQLHLCQLTWGVLRYKEGLQEFESKWKTLLRCGRCPRPRCPCCPRCPRHLVRYMQEFESKWKTLLSCGDSLFISLLGGRPEDARVNN